MALSSDLISQFVKATNDKQETKKETTVQGTIVYNGKTYVKLDGSDRLTPVSTTADVKDGDRVTVIIKDHTATVNGNISSPSARVEDLKDATAVNVTNEQITAIMGVFGSLTAKLAQFDKLEAVSADIEKLKAKYATLEYVDANTIKALNAEIENLTVKIGTFEDLSAEDFEALNAEITNLKGYNADFTYVSAENLKAHYANIDFANIGEVAVKKLFADAGIIKELATSNAYITGELVGVTIKGDLIEGETIKAENLIIKGDNGVYYRLNYYGGALTGETGIKTRYFVVDYNADTGAYTTTTEPVENPQGALVSSAYTTDVRDVYKLNLGDENTSNDDCYYCSDGLPEEKYYEVKRSYKDAYYLVNYDSEADAYIVPEDPIKYEIVTGVEITLLENIYTINGDAVYSTVTEDGITQFVCIRQDFDDVEYTVTSETIEVPEGTLVEGATTIIRREVYKTTNDVYYAIDLTYPDWAKNKLHGSNIAAKTLTADQIKVTDLFAFGATIGGFGIDNDSIHTLTKTSLENTVPGIYLSDDGQVVLGDAYNYLKFTKQEVYYPVEYDVNTGEYMVPIDYIEAEIQTVSDLTLLENIYTTDGDAVYSTTTEDGVTQYVCIRSAYKLDIAADNISFGVNSKSTASKLKAISEYVKIGTVTDDDSSDEKPCIELSEDDSDSKHVITNTKSVFIDGETVKTRVDTEGVYTDNVTVNEEFRQGGFVWATRENGNYGLIWKEVGV